MSGINYHREADRQWEDCPACDGTGDVNGEPCDACEGEGGRYVEVDWDEVKGDLDFHEGR